MSSVVTSEVALTAARPTWVEVSLSTLRQNFRTMQRHVGDVVIICAVVKADAYGHGDVQCALALQSEGAQWFGVASLEEAIRLRDAGVSRRILLMTGFWRGEEEPIVARGLTPIVWEAWQIDSLNWAAAKLGSARQAVHLKIDTGMGRLGATVAALPPLVEHLKAAEHLSLEGLCTHLASAEVLDAPSVDEQIKVLAEARALLRSLGLDPSFVHAANSSAAIARPNTRGNMVRIGLALYGYYLPFQQEGRPARDRVAEIGVKPVLSWKTRILALRDIEANRALGYGGTYVTKNPARIGVLPVGYADGLNRALSSAGRVIVRGHYAPIVGRISMNLTLIDVSGAAGVEVGDEVILLGSSGDLEVSAQEHADLAHTIPYEILCGISKTVPRKYLDAV